VPTFNVTYVGDYCVVTATSVVSYSYEPDDIEQSALNFLKKVCNIDPDLLGLVFDNAEEL